MRDMTEKQYQAALKRHGFTPGYLGYVYVTRNAMAYPGNAGNRRRDRLAYLLKARKRWEEEEGRKQGLVNRVTAEGRP